MTAQVEKPDAPRGALPILVNSLEAAAMLGIKRTQWYPLKTSAKLPAPVKLGRRDFWVREELLQWVASGCPNQSKWEQMKPRENGKKR